MANEEGGMPEVANINQLDSFTSPSKDVVTNTSSFFRAELNIFILPRRKKLALIGA